MGDYGKLKDRRQPRDWAICGDWEMCPITASTENVLHDPVCVYMNDDCRRLYGGVINAVRFYCSSLLLRPVHPPMALHEVLFCE